MLLAEAYGVTGQAETGCRVLTEAQAVVEQSGVRFYEAELYRLKGELLLTLSSDSRSQAEACFHRALEVAHQQQARSQPVKTPEHNFLPRHPPTTQGLTIAFP